MTLYCTYDSWGHLYIHKRNRCRALKQENTTQGCDLNRETRDRRNSSMHLTCDVDWGRFSATASISDMDTEAAALDEGEVEIFLLRRSLFFGVTADSVP